MFQQNLAQIVALDIIHYQILTARGFNKVIGNTGQVRMGEACQHHCLALKLFLRLWGNVRIFLDSNGATRQIQILGQIDRAHPALTQAVTDAITSLL